MNKELILNRVKLRRESIYFFDIFNGSLSAVEAKLDKLIQRYKKLESEDLQVVFDCSYVGYDGGIDVSADIYRWETMKEHDERKRRIEEREERTRKAQETKKANALAKALQTEDDERALLAQLQKKYGVK
jgi:hypothetical protein